MNRSGYWTWLGAAYLIVRIINSEEHIPMGESPMQLEDKLQPPIILLIYENGTPYSVPIHIFEGSKKEGPLS